jgi:hypothetical protein
MMYHPLLQLGLALCSILGATAALQLQERASFIGAPYIVSTLSSATHYGTIGSPNPSITRRQEPYYHQLTFTVYNPDPLANTTTSCSAEWPEREPVPTGVRCEDTAFAFSVEDWVGVEEFTLDVRNRFQDPRYVYILLYGELASPDVMDSVGQPPQDYVTLYGKEVLRLECVGGSQPKEEYCGLGTEFVELPIYAAIA